MPSVTLNEVAAVLKKDILPAVVDAVKQEALIYQIAKSKFTPQKFVNNKFYVPVKLALPAGFTTFGPTSTPTLNKGAVKPVEASFEVIQVAGSFSIDKITLDAGKGAVVDTLEMQTEGVKDLIVRQLNYQLWRAPNSSGYLVFYANGGANQNSTTLVIDENRAVQNGDIDYAIYLPPGTKIKIGTNNPTTVVAHIDKNTVQIADAQTWADNAAIYVLDGDGNPMTCLTGLLAAIGTGTYGGINPANYAMWKSYVDSPASATVLTLADVDKAHVEANQRGKVDYTFANKTLYNKFISLLKSNPQVQVTEKPVLHGGWVSIDYMGHDFILDYDVVDDCIFHISSKELSLGILSDLDFLPGNEGRLFKAYGKTEWEAIIYTSLQLVCRNRGAHSRIEKRTA
jgi:hypothetical protein